MTNAQLREKYRSKWLRCRSKSWVEFSPLQYWVRWPLFVLFRIVMRINSFGSWTTRQRKFYYRVVLGNMWENWNFRRLIREDVRAWKSQHTH